MKTFEAFQKELEPSLQKLENFRLEELAAAQKAQLYYIAPALLLILAIPVFWKVNPIMAFIVVGVAIFIGVRIALDVVGKPAKNYVGKFKKEVFPIIIKTFYPEVSYNAWNKVPMKTFLSSNLFSGVIQYDGADYFKGKTIDGNKFQFSGVDTLLKHNIIPQAALFKGLFFEIELSQNYQAKILVLPNNGKATQTIKDGLAQLSLNGLTAKGELVAVANVYPKFEKDFDVFSHSKEMAYNVLTPSLIEGIYQVQENWKIKPLLSFVNNKCYVAIPFEGNFFAPKIHDSLLDSKNIQTLYEELVLCFSVMNNIGLEVSKTALQGVFKENPALNANNNAIDHFLDNDK